MNRFLAIVEREMRKFFRSPVLMIMSMMLPLVQLVILGNAFGGKITGARVAVVDYDHGPQAVKVREAFDSIAANIATFTTVNYTDETHGARRCAHGQDGCGGDHSRAVFAAGVRAGCAAHRAGGGQLRPVHEQQPRGRDAVAGGRAECSR